jgi:Fe-S cluster assembly ATP-binding protein
MSQTPLFEVENLHVSIEDKQILKGINLTVNQGEVHALMGPNGSGKSTLAYVIAGSPDYEVTEGTIRYMGEDILEWSPDERAQKGLFLAFQYPTVIPGVSMASFLRMAVKNVREARAEEIALNGGEAKPFTPREFRKLMREKMALLKMDEGFATRYVNEGFSGGEKKRLEMLQMAMLVITHYQRLLNYIKPDYVHIVMDGRIVREGGPELALELEEKGYEGIRADVAATASN